MSRIGAMTMPEGFRYRNVFLKGKPKHERFDSFWIRHPNMDRGKRAKIFAPFDALRGFDEAVASKDVLYKDKTALSEEDTDELNRRLAILHGLTYNSRMARANHVEVTVTYYEPCMDENHEAYGLRGRYRTVTGICRRVDAEEAKTIWISAAREVRPGAPREPRTAADEIRISLEDVLKIESTGDIFKQEWVDL